VWPFKRAKPSLMPPAVETGKIRISGQVGEVYRHKFTDVVKILADWYRPFGNFTDRDILEFGCGEGTMALGIALQHKPTRIIGVEVLDVYQQCLPLARKNLGLSKLPDCLHLEQIKPGQDISHLGLFDFIYSWSVFEHVDRDLIQTALSSVASVLKPGGVFFLQISPLYYSAFGSHLGPWVAKPWAHLSMQDETFSKAFFSAPEASQEIADSWSVYLPQGTATVDKRRLIWATYQTLNKTTAAELARRANRAGLKIVRDYRTKSEHPIPEHLAELFERSALTTEQIVWLLQRSEDLNGQE
jgi:2-polyprenyl-3-methyl-5-hydroxy-6-metoxy-1,4-benzoquinol methylase